MIIGYIYLITNLKNHKKYIGSTIKNPARRWSEHKCSAKTGSNYRIHQAIRKYGVGSFNFEIIYCSKDIENLEIIENNIINDYNTLDYKIGYNMVPSFYSRPMVSKIMKEQWKNPETRKKRLQIQKDIAENRSLSICAINIYNGEIRYFKSVNEAIRSGFSSNAVIESLKQRAIVGQGNIWIYKENKADYQLIDHARKLLGGQFKEDFLIPIIGWNNEGIILNFSSSLDLKETEFEAKAVRRVCLGKRKTYKGYYWKFKK